MEIHRSSLTFYPVSTKRVSAEQTNNADLTANKELKSKTQAEQGFVNQSASVIAESGQQKQQFERTEPLSLIPENLPANSRILKALNTYSETVRQPVQDKLSQSSGIDFYV